MAVLDANAYWGRPGLSNGTGVLVLAGSSGRIDTARIDNLAARGVTALGVRWFGGEGLQPTPRAVPLEYFVEAVDLLAREYERLVVMGLSYGAEAALLTAALDDRIAGVVAIAPTDVAWEGQARNDEDAPVSKWTYRGKGIPFVPLDRSWQPPEGKPAFVDLYLRSREVAGADGVEDATIPVEKIEGEMLLIAGGDDKVWPSALAAERIQARGAAVGLETSVVIDAKAGHPVVLPGETASNFARPYLVGGDDGAPARLGKAAWPHIARMLNIEP